MITIKSILVPVDFSEASKAAFRYGYEFARSMEAKLYVINVVEPRPLAADMTLNYIPLEEDLERAAREDLRTLSDKAANDNIALETDVIIGSPADVILDKVVEYDASMLIMGSHGKTGLSRILMGSVTEAVMRKAEIPVLVVKASGKGFISE